jgi:chromate reductase, NAD(P)H dehydrogenase (quinone)
VILTVEARAPLKVLGIAGSVRPGSYNRALLEAAHELAPPGEIVLTIHDLSPLPLFRPETAPPAEVRDLIAAIADADALLVATPEYNYGVPSVLSSALEWASQPPCSSVLRGKPAALMGASTGRGGTVRAQLQLRQAFLYTGVCALLQPELMVDRAQDHFSADGRLTTPELRDRLGQLLAGLAAWTRLLTAGAAGNGRDPVPLPLSGENGNAAPAAHSPPTAALQQV